MANGGFQVRQFEQLLLFILETCRFIDRHERGQGSGQGPRQIVSHINNIYVHLGSGRWAVARTWGIVRRPAGEVALFAFSVTCNSISMATTAACLLHLAGQLQEEPHHHLPQLQFPSCRHTVCPMFQTKGFGPSSCISASQRNESLKPHGQQVLCSLHVSARWLITLEKQYQLVSEYFIRGVTSLMAKSKRIFIKLSNLFIKPNKWYIICPYTFLNSL